VSGGGVSGGLLLLGERVVGEEDHCVSVNEQRPTLYALTKKGCGVCVCVCVCVCVWVCVCGVGGTCRSVSLICCFVIDALSCFSVPRLLLSWAACEGHAVQRCCYTAHRG
jgi:hypothetical protein